MSILLILFLLFGLVLGGFGGSSSSSSNSDIKPVVTCSKWMTTDKQPAPSCGPPPAKP